MVTHYNQLLLSYSVIDNLMIKITSKKKLKPIKQVIIARPKEGTNIAYVPVTNAITIAPMEIMANQMEAANKSSSNFLITSSSRDNKSE